MRQAGRKYNQSQVIRTGQANVPVLRWAPNCIRSAAGNRDVSEPPSEFGPDVRTNTPPHPNGTLQGIDWPENTKT